MDNHKAINRKWMRDYRAKKQAMKLLSKGKCPVCGMLLSETYYHQGCPFVGSPMYRKLFPSSTQKLN